MKGFKGLFIKYEILIDMKLNDKEKMVFSMIEYLSKNMDCIITNSYISNLLNISKTQSSRIVNGLKKKGYVEVNLIYKENSKEIAYRKIRPIYKNDNTYKQINPKPIDKDVKDIINNNKTYYKKNRSYKTNRDYSHFNWTSLYANNLK